MPKTAIQIVAVCVILIAAVSDADDTTPWRDIDLTREQREVLALELMETGDPVLYVSQTLRYAIVTAGFEHLLRPRDLLEFEILTYSNPELLAETVVGILPEELDEVTWSGSTCGGLVGPPQCPLGCESWLGNYITWSSIERSCYPTEESGETCTSVWSKLCFTDSNISYSDSNCTTVVLDPPPSDVPDFWCSGPNGWTCSPTAAVCE